MRKLPIAIAIFAALAATAAPAEQSPDRLKAIGVLILAGKPAEARVQLHEAQAAYRAASDTKRDALCSLLLGIADAALGDGQSAEADLQTAAAKLQSSDDHFGAWFALYTLGAFESGRGDLHGGIAQYEKALAVVERADASEAPFALDTMRTLAPIFGLPEQNLDVFTAAPAITRIFLVPFAQSVTRDKYAEALIEVGELEKAEQQLQKAAARSAIFAGMFDSSIDAHVGDLRRRQRRFDEARKAYLKALGGAKQFPHVPAGTDIMQVDIMGRLAVLELDAGDPDAALAWNDKALQLVRASPNPKREASLLQDRANVLMRSSRLSASESTFNEALKIAEKLGDIHAQASIGADLGALDFFRGDYGKSAARLEGALRLFQKIDAGYEEAPVWALLAEDYVMLEVPSAAQDVLKRGKELAVKSKFPLAAALMDLIAKAKAVTGKDPSSTDLEASLKVWMALPEANGLMLSEDVGELLRAITSGGSGPRTLNGAAALPMIPAMAELVQGKTAFQRGDITGARAAFRRGLEKNLNGDLRAGYLAAIGATYLREGNDEEAIPYFTQAIDAIENVVGDLKVDELLSGYLGSNRRWYFDTLIELLLRKGRVAEAFDITERARARAFLQLVGSNGRINPARGADPTLVREADVLRGEIAELRASLARLDDSGETVATKLGDKQEQYNALVLRMKASNAEYRAMTRVETLRLEEVQKELPPDTSLVSYFTSALGIHAWVIDRDSIQYVPLASGRDALLAALCWADSFELTGAATRAAQPDSKPCVGNVATEVEAFETLFAPIRPKIRYSRLILVPHGKLHYVPFAALRDPDSGRYLVEDYVVSYAPSASALRFLAAKTPGGRGALVLGEPQTLMSTVPLPAASCEAVSIAGSLGVVPRLGARAVESSLYHLDGKVGLVHLAAHATFNAANPLYSSVLLASDREQDGSLEVADILERLDLTGVSLIALSACKTAVGGQSGGDEIVGFTRALLYAGSRDVISTLWNINDPASAQLMEEFYRRLLAGAPAADALQAAQVAMIGSQDYGDPKYWAAFNLTGDPRMRWQRDP